MRTTGLVQVIRSWLAHRLSMLAQANAGATAIEYALIAALISIAIIGGATFLGSQLSAEWIYVSNIVNPKLSQ